ncbi:hypothetical protein LOZ51_000124 [Ophidiomyces ophidiicola]|nr:hypothetical protein LOZ55_002750 [Ophidiomyces ophidiicola]KAI1994189.1 hypothetical protein LOZ54_001033 [Ophidiomyces ophidiicola]KAI2003051.1 hypothetical protein LOZ51_000124 [Ophidiomyces ophidiicola]
MAGSEFKAKALDFCSFVNASPTPFHAVSSVRKRLIEAGFQEIKEKHSWSSVCKPGGKYYLTRNGSTIIAFAIGRKWKPGNSISMVGAHTDSPCLRVKPVSKKQAEGFVQIGVETYGGGLWHTWFDRDLSIAGRVMARNKDGSISSQLFHIDRPILRIPTLAIHLDRQETFTFNKETQLFPIAGLVEAELARVGGSQANSELPKNDNDKSLSSSSALDDESSIRLIALFDHEEIGSRTAQGADSNALPAILRRLSCLPSPGADPTSTTYEQSLSTSFLISADMAHSVNPNYAFKYENEHKPEMNKGPVIKINANARYATNSPGIVLLQESARLAAKSDKDGVVPLQLFVVRNDSPCGSTIGPMLSAALGTRTLDLGNPQLSMHSIRETGGSKDIHYAVELFRSFFENYSNLSTKIFVD